MAQRRNQVQEIDTPLDEDDGSGGPVALVPATNAAGELLKLPEQVQTLRTYNVAQNAGSLKNYGGFRLMIEAAELFYPRDGKKHGVRFLGRLVDDQDNISGPATFVSFSQPVWRTMCTVFGNPPNTQWGAEPVKSAAFEPDPLVVAVVDQGVTFTIE